MKKFISISLALALFSCGGWVKSGDGSSTLAKLGAEPANCEFLYQMQVEAAVYTNEDAEQFLRNRIADQKRPGNAFWIASTRTQRNESAIFGPRNTFVIDAKIYDCPK
ncbi:MAG: hypothetical protein FWG39_03580 [Alphaproteobacteria bacterium]|nr:hypothetical protein [Alphaproteobacteria bacterium]